MKRKVIKQGHNTLTVTLPSKWVKDLNINAGDEIELIEKEKGILLTSEKHDGEAKRVEFDISDMDIPTIWKHFMSVYREGYDEVKVKFNPKSEIESPYKFMSEYRFDFKSKKHIGKRVMTSALQDFVNRFIGFEIVEHSKDYVLIRDMGAPTYKEFENSLRRVFLLFQQMAEETLDAIEKGDPSGLEAIHDIDINLDKFHDYCIRVLNKVGNQNGKKTHLLFSTLYILEMAADEFKNIAIHLTHDFNEFKFENIKKMVKFIKEQIGNYYDLFYKFDDEKVKKISELDQKTYLEVPIMYKKANEEEKEVFHHLRMIGRYINSLMELRIEMEY
jgi:phosphate uptake regulator